MYFNYLYEQFRHAKGLDKIDVSSMEFLKDFSNWLKEMQERGKLYINFLESIGINIDNYDIAEIGKGKSDSIVQDLTTTIITPYPEGLDRNGFNYCRLITAKFKIYDGVPALLNKDMNGNKILDTLSPTMFNTFMTQNPYTPKHIEYWDELHNKSDKRIIIGVFGSMYDKDSVDKINKLNEFKRKLDGSYQEDYITDGDTYSYVIASDKLKKRLRKRR